MCWPLEDTRHAPPPAFARLPLCQALSALTLLKWLLACHHPKKRPLTILFSRNLCPSVLFFFFFRSTAPNTSYYTTSFSIISLFSTFVVYGPSAAARMRVCAEAGVWLLSVLGGIPCAWHVSALGACSVGMGRTSSTGQGLTQGPFLAPQGPYPNPGKRALSYFTNDDVDSSSSLPKLTARGREEPEA